MFLLDDIILSPIKGLIFIGEKISDVVDKEIGDDGGIKEQLMTLQLRFELDEIDETEYKREEKYLLKRLDSIIREQEEL